MEFPSRKLHRLKSWDYSSNGYYFVTICTKDKRKLLSHVRSTQWGAEIVLTDFGKIVVQCWERAGEKYPYVFVDYYCVMPNHIHGIIVIDAPPQEHNTRLEHIVRGFKSVTTRLYNQMVLPEYKNKLWQSSYYDEIIRNDEMLYDIRKYIQGNPSKWLEDDLYIP